VQNNEEEKSPLFGSWNAFYAFVVFVLLFLIVVFYLFTKLFE